MYHEPGNQGLKYKSANGQTGVYENVPHGNDKYLGSIAGGAKGSALSICWRKEAKKNGNEMKSCLQQSHVKNRALNEVSKEK